jgi:hypothetical protein
MPRKNTTKRKPATGQLTQIPCNSEHLQAVSDKWPDVIGGEGEL